MALPLSKATKTKTIPFLAPSFLSALSFLQLIWLLLQPHSLDYLTSVWGPSSGNKLLRGSNGCSRRSGQGETPLQRYLLFWSIVSHEWIRMQSKVSFSKVICWKIQKDCYYSFQMSHEVLLEQHLTHVVWWRITDRRCKTGLSLP